LSAWDFDEAYRDGKNNDRENNDEEYVLIAVGYRHNDREEIDMIMMTTTGADRDDGDGYDE
jgi:hypothetical protein